ncbi:MAG: hypothetical protein CM1200mP4_4310 [Rhodospirillaceae bacterium]|nr:MAG: hypothetical protein CM1200mP4_4310 [Rhodospirillaceae bacterium]
MKKSRALLLLFLNEPVALAALKSPGERGADIVVGEGQSLGFGAKLWRPICWTFCN